MHKSSTVIVVGIDEKTPQDLENESLREYAKSSGPAGVGMSEERPEDKRDESIVDMAKRYGKEFIDYGLETADIVFGERPPYKVREVSDAVLDSGAAIRSSDGRSFTVDVPTSVSGTIDPSILDEVKPIDDQYGRGPDMVLMDWMGDEDEIDSRYLSDLYPSDERIDYLSRVAGGETLIPVRPDSVRQMTDDMRDYNRFGGDAVAMELDRRDSDVSGREYTDEDNDSMLRALMEENVEYADIVDAKEGFAAVREDLGRDVEIKVLGKSGTKTTYSAYSPNIGRLQYSYDSATGVGRILGSQ